MGSVMRSSVLDEFPQFRSAGRGGAQRSQIVSTVTDVERGPVRAGSQVSQLWDLPELQVAAVSCPPQHPFHRGAGGGSQGGTWGLLPGGAGLGVNPGCGWLPLGPLPQSSCPQVAGLCPAAALGAPGLPLHPPGPGEAEQVAGGRVSWAAPVGMGGLLGFLSTCCARHFPGRGNSVSRLSHARDQGPSTARHADRGDT